MATAPVMIPKLAATMEACDPKGRAAGERFTLVVRLAVDGSVQESFVVPSTELSECFRSRVAKDGFPSAPLEDHWFEIEMHRSVE